MFGQAFGVEIFLIPCEAFVRLNAVSGGCFCRPRLVEAREREKLAQDGYATVRVTRYPIAAANAVRAIPQQRSAIVTATGQPRSVAWLVRSYVP